MIALASSGVADRRVFISYRRQVSEHLAQRVSQHLIEHKFNTFVDLNDLDSGDFESKILSQIERREHFIVLLEPGSLDRIGEEGDWLRREIVHALAHRRNVIPVTASGFEFRRDLVLPPDVARLRRFEAVDIPPRYFNAAMKLLRSERFLKKPPKPTASPPPVSRSFQRLRATQASARPVKPSTGKAVVLSAPELTQGLRWKPGEVQLTWSEVPGADEYVLERAEVRAGPSALVAMTSSRFPPADFREVYRGPNRSYIETIDPRVRVIRLGPAPSALFRVRASFFGRAGEWSNILQVAS